MPIDPAPGLHVLVIEDQRDIAANIWDYLERRGHRVDHCADGASGLQRATRDTFDAIVLDLGLPRLDGLDLCRQLRAAGNGVPVLMLTARDSLEDKLRGFAEGADDYMVKPFSLRELEARLRALTRRATPTAQDLAVGDLRYEPKAMLAVRAGQPIPLTRLQGALLAELLRRAFALTLPAGETVTFAGHRSGEELSRLYATADVFVFPSTTDTFGNVTLEAMASGLPVIAAPAGGVADHLRDDLNGLAYPAGDVEAMAALRRGCRG